MVDRLLFLLIQIAGIKLADGKLWQFFFFGCLPKFIIYHVLSGTMLAGIRKIDCVWINHSCSQRPSRNVSHIFWILKIGVEEKVEVRVRGVGRVQAIKWDVVNLIPLWDMFRSASPEQLSWFSQGNWPVSSWPFILYQLSFSCF